MEICQLITKQWMDERRNQEGNNFPELNENTTQWNLWNTLKAVLWGNIISLSAYIKISEETQINDLINQLEKCVGGTNQI